MAKRDEKISQLDPKNIAKSMEAREQQMVGYAVDLAEKQLREGTASSQVITHYLKLGSTTARLEKEKAKKELELLEAKTEALKAQKRMDELYAKAIDAMNTYKGTPSLEVPDEFE